jgi:hypothetical protein
MVNVTVTTAGTSGPRGNTWFQGTSAPSDTVGLPGDYYLDQQNPNEPTYYGPKTIGNTWTGTGPYTFGSGSSGVQTVTATDTSVVVSGTSTNPTVATNTLDVIAADHPPAANWSNNSHKITGLANGSASSDAAAFGQIPVGATSSVAGIIQLSGDLGNTSASPEVLSTHLSAPLPIAQGGTGAAAQVWSGLLTPTGVKTSAYTVVPGDFVPVDTSSASVVLTLPTAPANLTAVGVKIINITTPNTVTVNTGGSDVFNKTGGGTSLTLKLLSQGVILQYASASAIWYVYGDDIPLSQLDARYLQLAGDITGGTTAAPQVTATHLASPLPVAQGGTGSSSLSGAGILQSSNNLSDVASASTSRTNLGLGTAATAGAATTSAEGIVQLAGDFSGTATSPTVVSTHLASPLPLAQGGTGASSLSAAGILQASNNLSDISNASTARTNLGLGTAATAGAATSGAEGIIQLAGDLNGGSASSPQVTSTHLSAALPILQGGTSATTASAALSALNGTPISVTRSITASTVTANAWDVLECNATSNPITVTPPTNTAGVRFTIKKTDSSANAVTFSGTVDGVSNPTVIVQYQAVTYIGDGTNWYSVAIGGPLGVVDTTDIPQKLGAVASAGSGTLASAQNHVHPRTYWAPEDYSFISWTFDPAMCNASSGATSSNGVLQLSRIHVPVGTTITNVVLFVTAGGTSLTSGQNFAGLYNASGTLLSATADQSGGWTGPGEKIIALTSAQVVAAGDYYVAFFANGTGTNPAFARAIATDSVVNVGLSAANSRFATGAGSLTTAMPGSYGTLAGQSNAYWAAVS